MNKLNICLNNALGLESININTNLKIHQGLTAVIEDVRQSGTLKLINKRTDLIGKYIQDTMGINAQFTVSPDKFANAMVEFRKSDIMSTSPMTNFPKEYSILKGGQKGDLKNMGKFEGYIDVVNVKLKGGLSKLKFPITITEGLMLNPMYTSGEVAAIIEHECGHIFSMMARFNDVARVNYAIYTAIDQIYDIEDRSKRVSAIEAFKRNRVLNTLDADPDLDKNVALSKALGKYFSVSNTADGMDNYSLRSWEFSSDQFATRLGAGRDLYTALDKIMRDKGADALSDGAEAVQAAAIKFLMLSLFSLLGPLGAIIFAYLQLIMLATAIIMSDKKIYDDPAERLERIIQTNTSLLRDKRISKETRDRILGDNTLLRREVLGYKTRTNTPELLKRYLFGGKKAHNDKLMQQELEELLNGTSVESVARAKQISDLAKG